MSTSITFRISGTPLDAATSQPPAAGLQLPLRCAYSVQTRRTAGAAVTVEVEPGEDIVALQVAGGPLLLLHPDHARDLLDAGGASRGAPAAVGVTGQLPWTGAAARRDARPGQPAGHAAVLDWFGVVRAPEGDVETAEAIAAAIDGRVTEGLYRVAAEALPARFEAAQRVMDPAEVPAGGALLVFMHGTFVDTASTFGKLWLRNAEPLGHLLADYPGRAFAFEHPTILKSPIGNAIALVDSLPHGAVLHLVTHSRAGLVADVLLRAARLEPDAVLDRLFADAPAARAELGVLRERLRNKTITVQRVVRCACPARGTLLASRRLDAFLSVLQWLLGLAGVNATTQFVDLLAAVARQRTDAAAMPGLQAMMPDSALVRWLNAPLDGVDSELYVVAGDAEGDGVVSWLKTLVADGFFWSDNDMVVQTRSMYGGVPRAGGALAPKFRLFTGPQATHFSYFARPDLVAPLHAALRGQPGDDWKPIGARSRAGLDSSGSRARPDAGASRAAPGGDTGRPHVIVVPDLFGSVLATAGGETLWLTEQSLARFGMLAPAANPTLAATGLVPGHYEDLCRHLGASHHVTPFAYDWRLDIASQADALAAAITALAAARQQADQPIRILAHGMGGLLVRAVQARHPEAWRHVVAAPAARVVLLGVPHAGSWLPLRMLCGDETFGALFTAPGPLLQDRVVRETLAAMPGFLQLQAGLADPRSPLREVAGWRAAADAERLALGATGWHAPLDGWALPDETSLRRAAAFWQQLEHALPGWLRDGGKLVTVAGHAASTVAGIDVGKGTGVDVTTVDTGDRHVTLDSAMLPGVPAWRMAVQHDALPRTAQYFDALVDLLATGSTTRLVPLAGTGRGDALAQARTQRRALAHGGRLPAAPEGDAPLTAPAGDDPASDDARLTVRVLHGDLRFVKAPLLLGHYQSMTLSGTEAVVDMLVGGRMGKALRAGVYPDRLGSVQIFENGRQHHGGRRKQRMIPRPRAAIIVGLGEEGKLNAQQLAYTIRIGVLAFAERLTEDGAPPARFELAAALAGSGGSGVSVGGAALALAQGIFDANTRLREVGWPVVEALTIVEVYLDRATDAWRVLRLQAEATPERLVVDGYLQQGDGHLRRPLESSYRGAAYDFISATRAPGSSARMPVIAYSLDTRRARTEVRAQQAQGALVRELVEGASNSERSDGQIGRTLFNLLIPVEIEPYLAGSASMLMELDATTSTLPWELLDTDPEMPAPHREQQPPWAIRCKVIRKLRMTTYREQVVDAGTEDNMLIIGEPLADPAYGRLAGAQREAAAIAATARTAFGIHAERVTNLEPRADARRVINQLFARSYRIVHIAGHGTGPANAPHGDKKYGDTEYGGVVLSGKATYLGVNEVMAMRVTPELVFLNCCHLAQGSMKPPYDRAAFAAGIAGALIDIGVRCVIAAGWAIEDRAAELFATTFYEELFAGQRFIDAVGAARLAAWRLDPGGNTWAAYQCYGDPDWSWKAASGSHYPPPEEEYAGVASPTTLILVLQAIATEALYSPHEETRRNRDRLAWLEKTFAPQGWTERGDVAQEFGAAWAALPDRAQALTWLHRAVSAADGRSALNAVEMLAEQASLPGATLAELEEAVSYLGRLVERLPPTLPRLSLLGNAYRRMSMHQHAAGDAAAAAASLERARDHFERAAQCPAPGSLHKYYPMRARMACEVRASLLAQAAGVPPAGLADRPAAQLARELAELAREIDLAANADPKFWSIVAQSEQEILKGVLQRDLAASSRDIVESMKDLYKRIRTKRYWTHVADDARALLEAYLAVLDDGQDEERQAARCILDLLAGYATTVAELA